MKVRMPDKYSIAAILLVVVAGVLIALALVTNIGESTTVALVIAGMICAITGIFTLTFSGDEPVDPRLIGILPAQGSINLSRIMHHFDIRGNANFLPPRITGESRVMQFNPTSTEKVIIGSAPGSFRETGPPGLVTTPSSDLLIGDLKKKNALVIPDNEENITQLLRETIEDVLKLAPRVSARWSGSTVTLTFHDYPSMYGCNVIARNSPDYCTMNPCPMCSLCGALIAEGRDKVVTLERCSPGSSSKDVTAVFSIVP
jgi:hypothetical protein